MDFPLNYLAYPVYQLVGGDRTLREISLEVLCAEMARLDFSVQVIDGVVDEALRLTKALPLSDLIILTGDVALPVKNIQLGSVSKETSENLAWKDPSLITVRAFASMVVADMQRCLQNTPIWASILIGGKSSRMGQPKHLIKDSEGRSWLERTVAMVQPFVQGIVFSGRGEVADSLADFDRLPDIPGVVGPLNGILAAGRWQPHVSWLLLACDLPALNQAGLRWLISDRTAGCWGRVPKMAQAKHHEPLFAWYDFRAIPLFEQQLLAGNFRIGATAFHPKIDNPLIPESLSNAWQNVNTPEQLRNVIP